MALRRRPAEDEAQPRPLEVNASMTGTLSFKDPVNLQINGQFDGTLDTKGSLLIGDKAQVKATIRGEIISIAGSVEGTVTASRRLELLGSARVIGKVTTPRLIVQEGGTLHGTCEMLQEPAEPQGLEEGEGDDLHLGGGSVEGHHGGVEGDRQGVVGQEEHPEEGEGRRDGRPRLEEVAEGGVEESRQEQDVGGGEDEYHVHQEAHGSPLWDRGVIWVFPDWLQIPLT